MENVSLVDYNCIMCNKRQLTEFCLATSDNEDYINLQGDMSVHFVKCNYCELVQMLPQIDIQEDIINNSIESGDIIDKYRESSQYDVDRQYAMIDNMVHNCSFDISSKKIIYSRVRDINKDDINILDIGCGYGFLVNKLSESGYNVTGVDIDNNKIEYAKENMKGEFISEDITEAYCIDNANTYDIIVLSYVIGQITDIKDFLICIKKLLKDGGQILIEMYNANDSNINHLSIYNNNYYKLSELVYYNTRSFTQLMKLVGIEEYNIYPYQRLGLENLIDWVNNKIPEINSSSFSTDNNVYIDIERFYKKNKEKYKVSDTLVVIISNEL
jgi:2-polyprenyl-3-methyl-5-hydroxy-6-metoxy-1,4-benzoquinol methylase